MIECPFCPETELTGYRDTQTFESRDGWSEHMAFAHPDRLHTLLASRERENERDRALAALGEHARPETLIGLLRACGPSVGHR